MQNKHGQVYYMRRCIELGEMARQNGDPPVGATIVYQDEIIGEGIESGRSSNDITNHAEILAVRAAITAGHKELLPKAVLYTTHEPCIMCSYVIRHHRIATIVYGVAVAHIGGATSPFGVLTTEAVPQWGERPTVIGGVFEK